MKKKVGIITFFYKNINFGGQLQAFALCNYLNSLGVESEQICFDYLNNESFDTSDGCRNRNYNRIKLLLRSGSSVILKKILFKINKNKFDMREDAFKRFGKIIPHSGEIYNLNNINDSIKLYDCFVCGGDQIWNDFGFNSKVVDVFSLRFVPDTISKFSYSASIGSIVQKKEYITALTEGIRELKGVSIREKSTKVFLGKYINTNIEVVVDPVLLLDCNQWRKVINKGNKENKKEKYGLCYILGNNEKLHKYALKGLKKIGLKSYTFPFEGNATSAFYDRNVKLDYSSGPDGFLKRIDDSELVITNSYHAVLFSVLFHKNFYVYEDANANNRISDFLNEYNLVERKIDDITNISLKEINYNEVDMILKNNIEKSKDYINKMLLEFGD